MFTPILDSSQRRPLYEQLYRYIRGEIEAGRLAAGERLPSKRALAAHLKISVVTVEGAYGQLLAEGYLRSEPKRAFCSGRTGGAPLSRSGPHPVRAGPAHAGPPL